jgi:hypothetical protein
VVHALSEEQRRFDLRQVDVQETKDRTRRLDRGVDQGPTRISADDPEGARLGDPAQARQLAGVIVLAGGV